MTADILRIEGLKVEGRFEESKVVGALGLREVRLKSAGFEGLVSVDKVLGTSGEDGIADRVHDVAGTYKKNDKPRLFARFKRLFGAISGQKEPLDEATRNFLKEEVDKIKSNKQSNPAALAYFVGDVARLLKVEGGADDDAIGLDILGEDGDGEEDGGDVDKSNKSDEQLPKAIESSAEKEFKSLEDPKKIRVGDRIGWNAITDDDPPSGTYVVEKVEWWLFAANVEEDGAEDYFEGADSLLVKARLATDSVAESVYFSDRQLFEDLHTHEDPSTLKTNVSIGRVVEEAE